MKINFPKKIIFSLSLIIAAISLIQTKSAKASNSYDFSLINTAFADEKSDALDLTARKKILIEIINTSNDNIDSLKDRLSDINLDDDWSQIKDLFIKNLSDFNLYYESLKDKVTSTSTTISDIKEIAKDLKNWREDNYTPELKKITNMILIFQDEDLLKITSKRVDKISNDIKKMDKQNIIKTDALKIYLDQVNKKLNSSEEAKNKGKDLFYNSMINIITSSSTDNIIDATSTIKIEGLASDVSSSTKKINTKQAADIQDSIQNWITSSIKDIKDIYDIFLRMNEVIKKSLQ